MWVPHRRGCFCFSVVPFNASWQLQHWGIGQKIKISFKWEVKGWLEGFQQVLILLYYMKFYIQMRIMHQLLQIFFKMNETPKLLWTSWRTLSHSFVLMVSDSTALKSLIKMKLFLAVCKHTLPTITFFYGKAFLYSLNSVNRLFI